jgi:hypothetical protein
MSGQVTRREVEWERASCLGLETDLFYDHRTGLSEKGLTLQHLRRICFSCPIQRECLEIGVAHEPYGFWGGLAEDERKMLHARREGKVTHQLRDDLRELGLSYKKIVDHVLSIKRHFSYLDERKL